MTTDTHREQVAEASWRVFRYRGEGLCHKCSHKAHRQTVTTTGRVTGTVCCNVRHLADCPAVRAWKERT